jgi:hypothetical protein
MKAIHRIPTTQFGYVEIEEEYDCAEDAIADHNRLVKCYHDGEGLPAREWTKVRATMLNTGECDPDLMERMSHAQRWWVNETKKALRMLTDDNNEPYVE